MKSAQRAPMANWREHHKDYRITVPGEKEVSKIHAAEVRDISAEFRSKIMLADQADNKGLSVTSQRGAEICVQKIADAAGFHPQLVDWFARGQDNQMYAIDIKMESTKQENPQFTAVIKDSTLDHAAYKDAKKHFPDVEVEKVRATVTPVDPDRGPGSGPLSELESAFKEARQQQANTQQP